MGPVGNRAVDRVGEAATRPRGVGDTPGHQFDIKTEVATDAKSAVFGAQSATATAGRHILVGGADSIMEMSLGFREPSSPPS
jgi:hypothetical protein